MPSKKKKKKGGPKTFVNRINVQPVTITKVGPNLTGVHKATMQSNAPNYGNKVRPNPGCPKMMHEDFTEDLVDDSVFNLMSSKNVTGTSTSLATTSAPFALGAKIPVKIRENTMGKGPKGQFNTANRGETITNAQGSSNRQLKDCLSSDIKSVVQDTIRWEVAKPSVSSPGPQSQNHFHQPNKKPIHSPRGVPRSFLTRKDQTVIEPQNTVPIQPITRNFIQTIQRPYNEPITHTGIKQPTFEPIPQISAMQVGPNTQAFNNPSTRYSPTDLYDDLEKVENKEEDNEHDRESSTSPDIWQSGEKRVSAFERLGPLSQPKKPKLTINLSFDKEQPVREVVDGSKAPQENTYVPVHLRKDVLHSTDETVMKYVAQWPWAKFISIRRTAMNKSKSVGGSDGSAGPSITAMMMLKEQMDEIYQRDNSYLAISVTGYPPSWTKEDVLDAMLENLKGKSFIPCFIEFNSQECKFMVIRCRSALLAIHSLAFLIQKDGVQLSITISQVMISIIQLDFIPRLILRRRLAIACSDGAKLNLSAFTLEPDVSHFIYFPLNQLTNQVELMELQTDFVWAYLTELDLSHNRMTTIEGLNLESKAPKLKHLDLSYNCIERATMLLCCRSLPLTSLKMEGNPLCHNYTDPKEYVTVMKMMFPMLTMLDGIPIQLIGEFPAPNRNFCPHGANEIVDCFLQIYIPLIDSQTDDRVLLLNMYDENAVMTITYRPKFGFDADFRYPRNLLLKSRALLEGTTDFVTGKADIEKLLKRWPTFEHDPSSFTIDVMFHSDTSTIFRLGGILKLPGDSLAENDQYVAFARTIHLRTEDGVEYKIYNEMIYWDEPTEEYVNASFRQTAVQKKPLSFKFQTPPDYNSKKRLVTTFMKITQLPRKHSLRSLAQKDWDIREALDHFVKGIQS
ncbi:uncharacterized protein [Epargyreus clarus]|uniref:uncharacterized protein n=1 Tax=Epargyreus clarus TaxID=520877 RepID=UPI003C2E8873